MGEKGNHRNYNYWIIKINWFENKIVKYDQIKQTGEPMLAFIHCNHIYIYIYKTKIYIYI